MDAMPRVAIVHCPDYSRDAVERAVARLVAELGGMAAFVRPGARVLLKPRPDLARAAECWIIAGGAHHTGYSRFVKTEWMRDWAEMAGIEFLLIGAKTEPEELRKEIRWNEIGYRLGL